LFFAISDCTSYPLKSQYYDQISVSCGPLTFAPIPTNMWEIVWGTRHGKAHCDRR